MPERTPKKPASANGDHLGLEQRPAGAADRHGVAAGAAQDRAIGRAHQAEMGDERDDDRGDDRERHEGRLQAHEACSQSGALPPGLRQQEDGEPLPDEAHAEGDDDRRQIAKIDERAEQAGVDADRARAGRAMPSERRRRAARSAVTQPTKPTKVPIERSRSLTVMTNIWAIGRERDRDRQIEHQVEAEIAHRPRIEPGDGDQDQRQRQAGRAARSARRGVTKRSGRARGATGAEAEVTRRPRTRTGSPSPRSARRGRDRRRCGRC